MDYLPRQIFKQELFFYSFRGVVDFILNGKYQRTSWQGEFNKKNNQPGSGIGAPGGEKIHHKNRGLKAWRPPHKKGPNLHEWCAETNENSIF